MDKKLIEQSVLRPLMVDQKDSSQDDFPLAKVNDAVIGKMLTAVEVKRGYLATDVVDAVLSGDSAIILDGSKEALIVCTRGWKERAVEEPQTEVVVRGPREGFIENLRTNTALLRRKIKDPNLTLDAMRLGQRTKTDICIAYIKGLTNEKLVGEIKRRLKRINADAILESGYIEQFIEFWYPLRCLTP